MKNKRLIFPIYLLILLATLDLIIGTLYANRKRDYIHKVRTLHPYYHHGFRPEAGVEITWKYYRHMFYTNSLGLKDASRRKIEPGSAKRRILFMGDSFTEGIGFSFEKTFFGRLSAATDTARMEILNGAVAGYSPRLFYLKTKYLLEQQHVKVDALYLFPDISDVQDELAVEHFHPRQVSILLQVKTALIRFGKDHSAIGNIIYNIHHRRNLAQIQRIGNTADRSHEVLFSDMAKWTYDENIRKAWGERGMRLTESNTQALVDLCRSKGIRLKMFIYPWPDQIRVGDRQDLQVRRWTAFCQRNGIELVNLYPDFIDQGDPDSVIRRYFVSGDMHWNAEGHQFMSGRILPHLQEDSDVRLARHEGHQ